MVEVLKDIGRDQVEVRMCASKEVKLLFKRDYPNMEELFESIYLVIQASIGNLRLCESRDHRLLR